MARWALLRQRPSAGSSSRAVFLPARAKRRARVLLAARERRALSPQVPPAGSQREFSVPRAAMASRVSAVRVAAERWVPAQELPRQRSFLPVRGAGAKSASLRAREPVELALLP